MSTRYKYKSIYKYKDVKRKLYKINVKWLKIVLNLRPHRSILAMINANNDFKK